MPPEAARRAWRALAEGRWPIVESIERAGHRLVVARPTTSPGDGEARLSGAAGACQTERSHQLSLQETRVLTALAQGYSNKLIAYDLGLATSTVSTLLARARRKLGCRNRIELAHAGRALTRQLGHQGDAQEPA